MKYKITLYRNLYLQQHKMEMYCIDDIENDIEQKSEAEIHDSIFFILNSYFFILSEEKAIYFKTKYDYFIRSIEEIKEEIDE